MPVRLATPAGAVLLSCLLLALAGRTSEQLAGGIARGGGVRRAPGAAAGPIDRHLAAHRYYQRSEP